MPTEILSNDSENLFCFSSSLLPFRYQCLFQIGVLIMKLITLQGLRGGGFFRKILPGMRYLLTSKLSPNCNQREGSLNPIQMHVQCANRQDMKTQVEWAPPSSEPIPNNFEKGKPKIVQTLDPTLEKAATCRSILAFILPSKYASSQTYRTTGT